MGKKLMAVVATAVVSVGALLGAAFAADKLNENDQAFLMKAAQGNMAEVQLGTVATQRATGDRVKQFGQRMVQDHGLAQQQLMNMSKENSWVTPTEISDEQKQHHERLSQLSGEAFDKAYMEHMVKDHAMDVALYERASTTCENAALKGYATSTLPTLKEHLKQAREISGIKEEEAKPGL
jgi:putative membrane protein